MKVASNKFSILYLILTLNFSFTYDGFNKWLISKFDLIVPILMQR